MSRAEHVGPDSGDVHWLLTLGKCGLVSKADQIPYWRLLEICRLEGFLFVRGHSQRCQMRRLASFIAFAVDHAPTTTCQTHNCPTQVCRSCQKSSAGDARHRTWTSQLSSCCAGSTAIQLLSTETLSSDSTSWLWLSDESRILLRHGRCPSRASSIAAAEL